MARWKPHAPERLATAALELFEERGYDSTTVNEITDRAGLTKSSFFRHFTDKREVLFDSRALSDALLDGIAGAPPEAAAIDAVARGFGCAGDAVFTPERREFLARRAAVISRTPELREREALKEIGLVDAMIGALQERGVPHLTARVVAVLGALAFTIAYERWLDPAATDTFPEILQVALRDVRAVNLPG
ncbi:TetR/AcrR family transcriptional regulator [Pseudonocardia sp. CA-107938]|uniref:TetR/AcrR family transcriptional regulator n=1 Tax=Pseudonocardia sp. CA-107938 TaxID=3240021 RepID=UPI003D92BE84